MTVSQNAAPVPMNAKECRSRRIAGIMLILLALSAIFHITQRIPQIPDENVRIVVLFLVLTVGGPLCCGAWLLLRPRQPVLNQLVAALVVPALVFLPMYGFNLPVIIILPFFMAVSVFIIGYHSVFSVFSLQILPLLLFCLCIAPPHSTKSRLFFMLKVFPLLVWAHYLQLTFLLIICANFIRSSQGFEF